ncbi:MAG: hypothetical protein LBH32_07300 [Dysgonamonadaceae bacterium]|jgi:fructose-specific component phosphotransferase system IIB-like protein|nr:hypothetical protein [Dysgonamonadaceae bacterium]
MKKLTINVLTILLLSFWGFTNANAQFLNNTEKVDIVQISTWMTPAATAAVGKQYVSDNAGAVVYTNDAAANDSKWYQIPAGGNAYGQQLYYYKNVATGAYLKNTATEFAEEGDWDVSAAVTVPANDGSDALKWSKISSNWGNGPWLVNEVANTGTAPSAENKKAFFALTSLALMNGNGVFFDATYPQVAISNPGVGGNAWTAIEMTTVSSGVDNPDYTLNNPSYVDVIQISTWMTPNNTAWTGGKPYVSDNGTAVVYSNDAASDATKWYEIPAGAGIYGQQVYYYKNVATGAYLTGSTRAPGSGGDWTVSAATASSTNEKTNLYKWSKVITPNWGQGVWLVNEEGNTNTLPSGENKNSFFALTSLTLNSEFFGVDVPNVAVSNPHDGGNAWTAVQMTKVATAENPDILRFLENTEKAAIVQIATWMTPNNTAWTGGKPYVSDNGTAIVYSDEAANDATKWYEIPAGGNAFEKQVYYYKNVATGAYLTGSTRAPGAGGDWTVSAATASSTNEKTNLYKWSKVATPNWGQGVWLVNEEGNTNTLPSGENKNPFFVLTSLTLNSEFFGVDVPNVAVSNPHDGGNAWTAVQMSVLDAAAANPDYVPENTKTVDVIQIGTWMTPNNVAWTGAKPYVSDNGTAVVYSDEAANDATKWYEIPAGAGIYGQQVYYYKNVATGAYLTGSTRAPGAGGDWTVSAANASSTNEKTNLYKWSKVVTPNWGQGVWLVNEEGNTNTLPSSENKNPFFALTSLTLNSEFFGVDVPNVAVSNPHDGGNAWTAVQISVAQSGVANPDYVGNGLTYSIDRLNFFATDDGEDENAASYNEATHTITYKNGGWHRAGWNWEAEGGIDVSGYNQVWIKFDASALPKTGDGEGGATKIQYDVVYMDDTNAAVETGKTNEIRSNNTEYFYNLTPGKKVKRITLKSEAEGDVVLTDAYFFNKGIDPVDLIVTDLTWEPENPVLGDSILFSATIKNISEFASQDVKHGVTFSVKVPGTAGNGTLVAWSDNHLTGLQPGEEVTVTATGSPAKQGESGNGPAKWKPGAARTFTVTAQVNDQNDVVESDVANNFLSKDIVILPLGVQSIVAGGKVYAAAGKLYIVNFPADAVVSIYNVLAQEIGTYRAKDVNGMTLSQNLYIVKVQSGNSSANFKVLVK